MKGCIVVSITFVEGTNFLVDTPFEALLNSLVISRAGIDFPDGFIFAIGGEG